MKSNRLFGRAMALVLAVVTLLSLTVVVHADSSRDTPTKFTDVPNDAWYWYDLDYALANGYISGTSATTFSPNGNITRGQFVTILGRMMKAEVSGGDTKFTDVSAGSYYAPYVAWAADKGYVNGTSATTFAPDANITFQQMGVILNNYVQKSGSKLLIEDPVTYKDEASIASWAVDGMKLMAKYNLIPTDSAGNVRPNVSVTRAEGTVALVRLAKNLGIGRSDYVPAVRPSDYVKINDLAQITHQGVKLVDCGYDMLYLTVIVEVENTSNVPIYITNASFDIVDGSGKSLGVIDFADTSPMVIAPHEKGYCYRIESDVSGMLTSSTVFDVKPKIEVIESDIPWTTLKVGDFRWDVTDSLLGEQFEYLGTIKNDTGMDLGYTEVVVVFYDEAGRPVMVCWDVYPDYYWIADTESFHGSTYVPDGFDTSEIEYFKVYAGAVIG